MVHQFLQFYYDGDLVHPSKDHQAVDFWLHFLYSKTLTYQGYEDFDIDIQGAANFAWFNSVILKE